MWRVRPRAALAAAKPCRPACCRASREIPIVAKRCMVGKAWRGRKLVGAGHPKHQELGPSLTACPRRATS
eukprot:4355556-Lingulodinium_polyedra.AAC.1